jgi:alpha-L-fucosidase
MKHFSFLFLLACRLAAQPYSPTWESLDSHPVPQWYKDAKFGIFIHWGVYAVPGWCEKGKYAEWYQNGLQNDDTTRQQYHQTNFGTRSYYDLAADFHAELFRPEEWAKLFERSGARYIVLTSKHHDGYCLWPSQTANSTWGFPWNAKDVGPHRDLVGELFTAIRKTNVHPGLYYSLYEWFNPLYKKDKVAYANQHVWPQMKELVNTYQPDLFWTDGDWEVRDTGWRSQEFLAWLYNESPVKDRVVTFDRWGIDVRFHHGMVYTPEYEPDKDFKDHYFEESRGMGTSYGYNREEDAWDYTSSQALLLSLIDKASRGGNLLLDIGPDAHGKIPPIMQERLLDMGKWLAVNGEAIYGTERWSRTCQWSAGRRDYQPKKDNPNMEWRTTGDVMLKLTIDPDSGFAVKELFFTSNPSMKNVYAIFAKYPDDRTLIIRDFTPDANTTFTLLSSGEHLIWKKTGKDVLVTLPSLHSTDLKMPWAWAVRIHQ